MPTRETINLHIDRVVIDEAVHRAGPEAVRKAIESHWANDLNCDSRIPSGAAQPLADIVSSIRSGSPSRNSTHG